MKQGCVNTQNESGRGGGGGGYLEPKYTQNQANLLQIFVNPRPNKHPRPCGVDVGDGGGG